MRLIFWHGFICMITSFFRSWYAINKAQRTLHNCNAIGENSIVCFCAQRLAFNAFIVRPMKKKKSKNEEWSNYFVSDVRYSRGCPNKKNKKKKRWVREIQAFSKYLVVQFRIFIDRISKVYFLFTSRNVETVPWTVSIWWSGEQYSTVFR